MDHDSDRLTPRILAGALLAAVATVATLWAGRGFSLVGSFLASIIIFMLAAIVIAVLVAIVSALRGRGVPGPPLG